MHFHILKYKMEKTDVFIGKMYMMISHWMVNKFIWLLCDDCFIHCGSFRTLRHGRVFRKMSVLQHDSVTHSLLMQESIKLDAFLYDKNNYYCWQMSRVYYSTNISAFSFFKNLLCLRVLSWRRCKGRDAGLAWWRSSWGIDQSETSLHAGLT